MGGKYYVLYVCPTAMLAVFIASTLITKSNWMGAFAALALMTLLGFAGEVIPFGYAIGFRNNDALLARSTSAGLLVMAASGSLYLIVTYGAPGYSRNFIS